VVTGGVGKAEGPSSTAVLNLDTMQWEQPPASRTPYALAQHSATVVGRTKLLAFG
jgi:hypothetical protein